jgi:VanZ family protein
MTAPARRAWLTVGAGVALQLLITSLPGRDVPLSVGHPWDWLIHAGIYAGLAFLVVRATTLSGWARYSLVALGIALVVYGALDEVHQLFIPGRDGSASDWAFDSLGIAVGLFMGNWLMGSKAAKWLR